MTTETEDTKTIDSQISELLGNFSQKYHEVLQSLDQLSRGTFDDELATAKASLSLLAQGALLSDLAAADLRSRSLKRDVDFKKATAYSRLKGTKDADGKKLSEAALESAVTTDPEVQSTLQDQIEAERDYKNLNNILSLLKEAHLTFRSIKIKGIANG